MIGVGSYWFSFITLSVCLSLSTGSDHHYIFHHSNADDSNLQNTATPSLLPGLTDSLRVYNNHYYKGMYDCMTDNIVNLNDVKTEIMIISPGRMSTSLSTQDSFATCNTPVPLYDTFNHLCVTLDCHLYNMSSTMSVQLTLTTVVSVPFVIS